MKTHFEKDIESLARLKKKFFVTLATTIVFSVLTIATAVCTLIGKNNDYPITNKEAKQLVEIAKNDSAYNVTAKNFKHGLENELSAGKISKQKYEEEIAYLESPQFINRVVDAAKTADINNKVYARKKSFENCGQYVALSGLLTVGSGIATGAINKKRNRLKKRWFDKEEARGL